MCEISVKYQNLKVKPANESYSSTLQRSNQWFISATIQKNILVSRKYRNFDEYFSFEWKLLMNKKIFYQESVHFAWIWSISVQFNFINFLTMVQVFSFSSFFIYFVWLLKDDVMQLVFLFIDFFFFWNLVFFGQNFH